MLMGAGVSQLKMPLMAAVTSVLFSWLLKEQSRPAEGRRHAMGRLLRERFPPYDARLHCSAP